jgi:hypothetical protein
MMTAKACENNLYQWRIALISAVACRWQQCHGKANHQRGGISAQSGMAAYQRRLAAWRGV